MNEFSKEFRLDEGILAPGSAARLTIGSPSDPALLTAITRDDKFPEGDIEVGRISFTADAGSEILFRGASAGGGTRLNVVARG